MGQDLQKGKDPAPPSWGEGEVNGEVWLGAEKMVHPQPPNTGEKMVQSMTLCN